MKLLKAVWAEDKAENMPEYALLLFLIALTAVSAVGGVATQLNKICFAASLHMTMASNPALTSASTGYASETPANRDSDPREANQEIKH